MDWVKIVSIVAVAMVTIVAFALEVSPDIQEKLALGLLILTGAYGVGAGIKFTVDRISKGGQSGH